MTSTKTAAMTDSSVAAQYPLRRGAMIVILLTGQAMAAMDNSILNVAAPAIRDDLGASGALLQMIVAGYLLAYAVLLITAAQLGNVHGYRRIFIAGIALFTAASLACGLAPNASFLIAARVVQGVGAALLVPQVLSLIQRHFEGQARARVVGYYSMILAVGVTLGQLLGGVIVTVDFFGLGWRPAFLINVPIGLAVLAWAAAALPDTRGTAGRKFDLAGVAVLTLTVLLVFVPLTFGRQAGWPVWTWISLALGLLGLVGFVALEKSVARSGANPLLNIDIFGSAGVAAGLLVVFVGFICFGGLLFSMALYLQLGLGFSPLESGFVFVAYSIGFGTANLTWSKMPARILRWTPTTALLAMALAAGLFGAVAERSGWTPALMLPLLLISGIGHGFGYGPVVNQTAARIKPASVPALSGLVAMSAQLAIVVGLATLGTFYLANAGAGPSATPNRALAIVGWSVGALALLGGMCSVRLATSRPQAAAKP